MRTQTRPPHAPVASPAPTASGAAAQPSNAAPATPPPPAPEAGRNASRFERPAPAAVAALTPSQVTARSEATVRAFFDAYSRADAPAMNAMLAPQTAYEDPVFPHLEGGQVARMWNVVAGGKTPVNADVQQLQAEGNHVDVQWVARYKFLGASINNHITSRFELNADGKVTSQKDSFDWRAWGNQTPFPLNLVLRTSVGQHLVQGALGRQIRED